jgi:ribonuclease HI
MIDEPSLKPERYALMNTDGGMVSSGRRKHDDPPGEAAIAMVLSQVQNRREKIIYAFSCSIGKRSNDEAEYVALVEGLRFALAAGVRRIRIYVDSEFVVDQMNHRSTVDKEGLQQLHNKAHDLLHRFVNWRISWIPRERNQLADELVSLIIK